METFLIALQLFGLAAQAFMLVGWGYIFNLQTPKLGKDPLYFKGGLVVVFVLWALIKKYGSNAPRSETSVTKPFRISMLIIGIYFCIAAAVCDFAGLSFPPWAENSLNIYTPYFPLLSPDCSPTLAKISRITI